MTPGAYFIRRLDKSLREAKLLPGFTVIVEEPFKALLPTMYCFEKLFAAISPFLIRQIDQVFGY